MAWENREQTKVNAYSTLRLVILMVAWQYCRKTKNSTNMDKKRCPIKPSKRGRKAHPHCSSSMERATKLIRRITRFFNESTRLVKSIRKFLCELWKLVKFIIIVILTILLLLGHPSAL